MEAHGSDAVGAVLRALFRVITRTNGTTRLRAGTDYLCEIRPLSSIIEAHQIEKVDLLKVDVRIAWSRSHDLWVILPHC